MGKDDQLVPTGVRGAAASMRERARVRQINQPFRPSTSMLDLDELNLFSWYVKRTENIVQEMLSDTLADIRKQEAAGREVINDSGMLAVEYFRKRSRYSHLIYLTSILETSLEQGCQELTELLGEENLLFTKKDLRGDKWSVKRKFLKAYGNILISEDVWSGIYTLICLRNNLVHDNGSTAALKDDDKKHLAKTPGIILTSSTIEFEPEYIHSAVESIRRLVQLVDTGLSAFINRAVRPEGLENPQPST